MTKEAQPPAVKRPMYGKLKLPKGALILDYNQPAQAYFDYELAPRDVLTRLAFLGAIAKIQINGEPGIHDATDQTLQRAGIGRKSLDSGLGMTGLMGSILSCDPDRFKILDSAPDVINSTHFKFDDWDLKFSDPDNDIYLNTLWAAEVQEKGRMKAHIEDIKRYGLFNDKPITDEHFKATVFEGGLGWLLGAVLLSASITRGKFEQSIPELLSEFPDGASMTS